ncbi:hypothetical protein [Streptomyces sp. NPDC058664]|uniref:hypothetical protein n=1 Tax=unclassified Streptomyces TaxID=2593676 RepID=UPI00366A1A18
MSSPTLDRQQEIRAEALPLDTGQSFDPLLERIGNARFVLLGEASHGTAEYYRWRAVLTRRLLLSYLKGLRFIQIEAFNTPAALTATGPLHAGHSWAAVHAVHAARPSADFPADRFLLSLAPELYDGTDVQAVHPDQ